MTVTAGALRLPALRLPQSALMICRVGKRSAPTTRSTEQALMSCRVGKRSAPTTQPTEQALMGNVGWVSEAHPPHGPRSRR
ncbi:hypothetical protein C3D70_01405 [Cronobacter sakazakii]|nr:hypothetical protein [Cronobacter sakazakii]EGT5766945.1 hypothetical protein [Cronobacter sakazakii]PPX88471.1 hypothetical protein C3D70_01405 [Cronobacter sakazakii]